MKNLLSFFIIILVTFFSLSCNRRLCPKEQLNSPCKCNPYYTNYEVTTGELRQGALKEVKQCLDVMLNAEALDKEYAKATLKGCLSTSTVIDSFALQKLINQIDKIPVPTKEYMDWLECWNREVLKNTKNPKLGVILMDAHAPKTVYCEATRNIGGSNTHNISNLLKDLDIAIHTVSTNLQWQDEQRVINLSNKIFKETDQPALIIIHASAFYEATKEIAANQRLLNFLDAMKEEHVKILVYTRGLPTNSKPDLEKRWKNILDKLKEEEIAKKVTLHIMTKGYDSCFADSEVSQPFKKVVKQLLKNEL